MNEQLFKVAADYEPAGDQADAIELLAAGIESGFERQTLKGVTGSGKTFTMAKIIEKVQRPTLILSHNKTLAAQLFREFKSFFPDNAVGYFVSTYDYYQPEAYVPGKDLYIEKDADINEEIDRLRLFASFALMERRDVIIVATVSCIFGLGNPMSLKDMVKTFTVGNTFDHKEDIEQLVRMQYDRNDVILQRGSFRLRGDVLEICPSYMETAVRITISWDEIESITWFDPVSGNTLSIEQSFTLYPAKQFVMPPEQIRTAIDRIKEEMSRQHEFFLSQGKLLEAERIKTRVEYDVEMLQELGYCSGIENYSRPLGNRMPGEAPPVLLNYFPEGFLTFIDESHVTLPQIGAMYEGDRSRKLNLVNYGFRLPSALDNRPLKYDEFDKTCGQRIYVSATPGKREITESAQVVEQVIRPTGLLDPIVEVRPTVGQMEDLYGEIRTTIAKHERVLVTTLTKRMAEDLSDYLANLGLRVRYLHSEIETIERVELLRDLRLGTYDVLVGINLLREGLDLPEVSLIAILDADKIGFLRSATSLIQTIGRAARNVDGRVIMYADRMSDAMTEAISETNRRRSIQEAFNTEHGITPKTIVKAIQDIITREKQDKQEIQKDDIKVLRSKYNLLVASDRKKYIHDLEREMLEHAKNLEFEQAALLRDEIDEIKKNNIS
ncbi:MAG: excinuclease ABC subunit UvrB [Sphaerochaetaceae bacterium]|jgi:excinuclease ABC subunit B|nr:excinuclease ABC subunit UvrB [Sphaerochaetaceae bacterium]NLO60093.1 excinuclease ABC subunit UvrB [Spirochaetales bacterium]MDD2405166.1 excinuclease ABC subunit UvrB [Sphaerochaetaceae bacterium]MDD4259340.1 excinuclease ABC subunit UvrB [Sphaerochaetaceae bacterium]MDD4841554.1 excinuclease ABC subunit UvrB [Sphaerochaetaceae bacterium]